PNPPPNSSGQELRPRPIVMLRRHGRGARSIVALMWRYRRARDASPNEPAPESIAFAFARAIVSRAVSAPASDDRVFDRLDRAGANSLARGLGGELLLLLGERVDALARGARGLLDDHELREAVQDEDARLLELFVPHVDERLDDLFDLLA